MAKKFTNCFHLYKSNDMDTKIKTYFPVHIKVEYSHDKNSNCWIIYSKKYEISGYGKTMAKAREMFEFCVKDILLHTKPKKIKTK